jgi:glutamate dehydrogenase (NADP+)
VGGREIGFMFGMYKKLRNEFTGVLTGKGLDWGGSLVRTEATGYGLIYFLLEMLKDMGKELKGSTVVISGSGNVAIYATEKVQQLGGNVVALSDSNGYIYDKEGINLKTVKQLKEVERKRLKEYIKIHPKATYEEGCDNIWKVKCDIALPSATQNEIDERSAKKLVENGVWAVAEGANMPSTPEAVKVFLKNKIAFGPAKAANAGGVATSGLEMSQNSQRLSWSFEETDKYLNRIMKAVYKQSKEAAEEYGQAGNLVVGANIAGFSKVAKAMYAQGLV